MQNIQTYIDIQTQKFKRSIEVIDNFPNIWLEKALQDQEAFPILKALLEDYAAPFSDNDKLQDVLLKNLDKELVFTNNKEFELINKVIINNGIYTPKLKEEIITSKALIVRMIIEKKISKNVFSLYLSKEFEEKIRAFQKNTELQIYRQIFQEYDSYIRGMLYYIGFMPLDLCVNIFQEKFKDIYPEEILASICSRYLQFYFKNISLANGNILILHEGWSNHQNLQEIFGEIQNFTAEINDRHIILAAQNILPDEKLSNAQFIRSISTLIDENLTPEEIALSMRLLIKQNITFEQLCGILGNLLLTSLSPLQKEALKNLYYTTPRWITLQSNRAN